jgi:CRP-like cAMP-binding protein
MTPPGASVADRADAAGKEEQKRKREPSFDVCDRVFSKGEQKRFAAGDRIVQQGQTAQAVYFIVSGSVQVQIDHLGKDVRINELGSREVFGEMSFLMGSAASASVIALEDMQVAAIDHAVVNKLTADDPKIAAQFYRYLSERLANRLRHTNEGFVSVNHLVADSG